MRTRWDFDLWLHRNSIFATLMEMRTGYGMGWGLHYNLENNLSAGYTEQE